MVDFYEEWYKNLIRHSNEKDLLVQKISDLLKGKTHESCLEIGLGTSAHFAEKLGGFFKDYWIVEKQPFNGPIPSNVKVIHADFEHVVLDKKFDVILASHVVYYFKDLSRSIEKMLSLLKPGGRVYFVVNGKESDYGPIKHAFGEMIHQPYVFTYEILKEKLRGLKTKEYTTQASLNFESYEDLYETLRLSFDLFPKEYEENKEKIIAWLKENVLGDAFFIDQKIIEVTKSLVLHERHKLHFGEIEINVLNSVFTPDPNLTFSSSLILENLPELAGTQVADIGTGTGIIAITAVKRGAREVLATDISDVAIENAQMNVAANGVGDKVKIVKTNLLAGVEGKFDVIFANLPILDEIWDLKKGDARSTIESFLYQAKDRLTPNGKIYLVWSSLGGKKEAVEEMFGVCGYTFNLVQKEKLGNVWYLYILSHSIHVQSRNQN